MNAYASILDLEDVRTRYSFEYTIHDGPLTGNTYCIGLSWDDEETSVEAADNFQRLMNAHNCRVTTTQKSRHSICL